MEVLNRSAIVFIAACWEAYVEDLLLESLDILIATPPPAWAPALRAAAQKKLAPFHTPKSSQVSDLFRSVIGLSDLTQSWQWRNRSASTAMTKLDAFLTLRGSVAHRLKLTRSVYKHEAQAFLNHVERLAKKTDSRLQRLLARYNRQRAIASSAIAGRAAAIPPMPHIISL